MDKQENLFTEEQPVSEDSLVRLATAVERLKSLETRVKLAEEELKLHQKELETVSREVIPSLLNELGLSELRLATGEKVEVKDKIKSSIADKNYIQAFRNMVEAEGGDAHAEEVIESLFKSQAVIEDPTENIFNILLDNGIIYESKKSIHWQTLNKYCREKLEQGKPIPEGISVFQYQETVLK